MLSTICAIFTGYTNKLVSRATYCAEMEIRFAQSARKHRIGKAHAMYVMENNPFQTLVNDDKVQQIWIALDDRGLELEIVAVVLSNCLLVTHVMPTALRRRRKKWLDE